MRIIFTNGCFDLLHVGHLYLLQEARAMGDYLIVGLNSDRSVRRLKGEGRPIVPQEERAAMLRALRCVDSVEVFEEDTPIALIERLRPHIHVKGGDYREEDLPEAPVVRSYGGAVRIVPLLEGRSTTRLSRVLASLGL